MIRGDAEVTIGSTLTACAAPHVSNKVINAVFVSGDVPSAVLKAAAAGKPSTKVAIHYYTSISQIWETLSTFTGGQYYITIYLQSVQNHVPLDLLALLEKIMSNPNVKALAGITLLLDDRTGLGKIGPKKLG